jgi:KUP system potassium uptake protein
MHTDDTVAIDHTQGGSSSRRLALMLAALGVVFGDIGTSPLYALSTCFSPNALALNSDNVLGTVSLLFWLLVIIVCVKYVLIVLCADNRGEGGIIALQALVGRIGPPRLRHGMLLIACAILGASLLFSDGVITPAISVLSAVEGVTVTMPDFKLVIPVTLIVLAALFFIQSRGTAKVGLLFGPVMFVWFVVIALLGVNSIAQHPEILQALNPAWAVRLLMNNGWVGFAIMGTVFLALTGAEMLYADIGHFGKEPIRNTWFALVFPALFLNYMGQGAFLLHVSVAPTSNLFYRLAPEICVPALVALATLATIIASQAVITGTFSLARQAVQLGFWPRLRIVHTSASTIGQVYVPFINFALFVCTVGMILVFQTSEKLAAAYGIAVSATMLITTMLMTIVAPVLWPKTPRFILWGIAAIFLLIDMLLFGANILKVQSGGWVVALCAAVLALLMSTWLSGRSMLRKIASAQSFPMEDFVQDVGRVQPVRVPGTAVFLSSGTAVVPRALLHNYRHNKILHARTLVVAVLTEETPTVPENERSEVSSMGYGFTQVTLRFGFMENPDVPATLANLDLPDGSFDPTRASYFLGKESLVFSRTSKMSYWRRRLFALLARNAQSAAAFFGLPPNRVVELGVQVEM